MKVYRISKKAFLGICLLILLLPLSRHWKLMSSGARTTGTVSEYVSRTVENRRGKKRLMEASEIEFNVDGETYKAYGPEDYEYEEGRTLTIFYKKKNPEVNCVACFTGFYLTNYAVVPLILLIVWYAFYLSFNNYRKKLKMPKGRPAKPQTQPIRRIPPL